MGLTGYLKKRGRIDMFTPYARLLSHNKMSKNLRKNLPFITAEEVKKHNTETDGWYIYDGGVYNVTPHLLNEVKDSAGRTSTYLGILRILGTDCTEEMKEIDHSDKAMAQMEHFKIGLVHCSRESVASHPLC
jgi:cytochrome b involved in lipid metabolism